MMLRQLALKALRPLTRQWLFTAVNLLGLAIALACCFVIGLYLQDELGFDRWQPASERLYRVSSTAPGDAGKGSAATTPLVGPLLPTDFGEVESTARLLPLTGLLRYGNTAFYENNVRFVDPSLLTLFRFDWLAGDAATALNAPGSIVLTQTLARKYFGSGDPLGKLLQFEQDVPLTVTGVIRDLPPDTHLSASALASLQSLVPSRAALLDGWSYTGFHTYLRLRPGADAQALQRQLPDFLDHHYAAGASKTKALTLMPVTDIHLHSTLAFELKPPGTPGRLVVFAAASLCILLIAAINFMNLTLAALARRSAEVGLRKVLGARTAVLVLQLLAESIWLAMLAAVLALALVELVLPLFNALTGKALALSVFANLWLWAGHVAAVLAVALLAGLYPALYQASTSTTALLKGAVRRGRTAQGFRNGVIVLQFAIAIALLVAGLVVQRQLAFMQDYDQGFDERNLLVLRGSPTQGVFAEAGVLKQRLLALPGVRTVTASNQVPYEVNGNSVTVWAEGDANGRYLPFMLVDYDFFATYDIPLRSGRFLSPQFPADALVLPDAAHADTPGNVVLNATAAAQYGWSADTAVGKEFRIYHAGKLTRGQVVGVVRDAGFESARSAVKPMVFLVPTTPQWKGIASWTQLTVQLAPQPETQRQATLAAIAGVWHDVLPQQPLQPRWLADDKRAQYADERKLQLWVNVFSALSLFIAGIGLFALAAFHTAERTKEIGIRKVMGSGVWQIVYLLTEHFSRLVLLANLLAWPVAYYAMTRWLQNFAHHVDLTPLLFVGSGLIALCIAWATVGGTAAKAASRKPVLALRYE
ncbi:MAG TPA: ABC transporter permease [Candidatus Acidoferrum sp.]|nr:ABC transporter permease [Candidatus Acidoferrum sp.]